MAVHPPYASTSSVPPPAAAEEDDIFPPLATADVLACQFSSWYPRFKRVSPKATVIRPIPHQADFLEYLESDGLFLPEGSGPMGVSELSDDESDEEEQPDSDDDEPAKQFAFPHLDAEIRSVLERYEGAVFPKLNWSSPQDAAWMIPGQNLKCQTPADVYLLLKSSDFISHDLDHALEGCVDYPPSATSATPSTFSRPPPELDEEELARLTISGGGEQRRARDRPYEFELVLKKWFDMPKSQEWRCFVREGVFLGISQRDTTYYDFLQPEQVQRDLQALIRTFWEGEVRDKAPLRGYAFDVYLTRDNSRVFLIDLNPYSPSTDPLLFSYEQLAALFRASSSPDSSSSSSPTPPLPVLRLITSPSQSASSMPRYSHNRYPKDVVELSEGQSVAEFAKEWMGRVAEAAVDGKEEGEQLQEEKVEERVGR
ncbi:hypothetical protein JCM10213_000415 [Rhodosporidiobolus nylandii]